MYCSVFPLIKQQKKVKECLIESGKSFPRDKIKQHSASGVKENASVTIAMI